MAVLGWALLLVLVGSNDFCLGYSRSFDFESREERNYPPPPHQALEDYNTQRRCDAGNCVCSQEYIPFCGSDGITYDNKCQLQCAQSCDPGLRVHFEGVCARPYIHDDGSRRNQNNRALPRPTQVSTGPITVVGNSNQGYASSGKYGNTFPTTVTKSPPRPNSYQIPIYRVPPTPYYTSIPHVPTHRYDNVDSDRYPVNPTPNPYPTRSPPSRPVPTTTARPLGRYQQWLATSTTERSWFVPPPREFNSINNNRLDWR